MKLSREEAWAGTLESMVDNRVVFYLRRYNRDYQDYSRQMKELCEKYPAIIQLIDGNNGVTLNDEEYQVFKTYSELSSNREMLERAYYYYFGQADMFHYQKLLKEIWKEKSGSLPTMGASIHSEEMETVMFMQIVSTAQKWSVRNWNMAKWKNCNRLCAV